MIDIKKLPISLIKLSRGFGLIELLIAIALSSIVAIVVVQLFIQNKASYLAQEATTRTQENGRYAIHLLTNAIKSADFWGCIPSFAADTQSTSFSWPEDGVLNIVSGLPAGFSGVRGLEGAATTGLAGFPSQPDSLIISGIQRGRSFPLEEKIGATSTDPITISLNKSTQSFIQPNDILVISDCANSVIFQATNDVDATVTISGAADIPNTATITHTIVPATAPATAYNNIQDNLGYAFKKHTTTVFQNVSTDVTYTVNPSVDHDGLSATPSIPSLMRSTNGGAPQAIVPGIETMQVMYGEDTNVPYDFQADRYVTANNVADWESVVSVRISILARSPDANNDATPDYSIEGVNVDSTNIPADANGKFHSRKVYTTTVSIRNRMS
jgi:type IV pilus assembly protein PilW